MKLSDQERAERRKVSLRKAQQKYRESHRDILLKRNRDRRKANLAEAARRMREYRKKRPDLFKKYESNRTRSAEQRKRFNAYRRTYAKLNPDKQREFAHKRDGRKVGKLESGSISKIGSLQKWKCTVCNAGLKKTGYHMDHIIPLSKGGKHSHLNIQLLCPACNLSKASKDPIAFMREKGYLL